MKRTFVKFAVAGGLAVSMASGAALAAGGPTDQDILKDAETPGDILTYGMGTQGQRYSPLKAVNPDTVKQLVPVWAFSFGGEKQRGQESQPIVHDGKMYVTASYSRLFALDATHRQEEVAVRRTACPTASCRAATWSTAAPRMYGDKVYLRARSTPSSSRSNKDTGKVVWKKKIDDYQAGYSNTAAPLIVEGQGASPAFRAASSASSARVEARDAETGELVWYAPDRRRPHGLQLRRRQGRARHHRARPTPPGRATCGRPAARATWLGGTYDPETEPALLRHRQPGARGTATCARATISTRCLDAGDRSGRPARSSGTTRPRRTTAGTSTASTSSSRST